MPPGQLKEVEVQSSNQAKNAHKPEDSVLLLVVADLEQLDSARTSDSDSGQQRRVLSRLRTPARLLSMRPPTFFVQRPTYHDPTERLIGWCGSSLPVEAVDALCEA